MFSIPIGTLGGPLLLISSRELGRKLAMIGATVAEIAQYVGAGAATPTSRASRPGEHEQFHRRWA
jgi:hypothetical protein